MSEKSPSPPKSKDAREHPAGKPSQVPVSCGMEECDHRSNLRFVGESPFDGFTFETPGWTVVEDTEEKRTVFLCTDCAREFEQELAGDEEEPEDDEELKDDPDGR